VTAWAEIAVDVLRSTIEAVESSYLVSGFGLWFLWPTTRLDSKLINESCAVS